MKHDVVIIGGSLAGAACARELARLGVDAVALERDHFPRRKVCGGFVSPGAVRALAELGVLADVMAAGAVEVRLARVCANSVEVEIPFEQAALGISRNALDDVLAGVPNVRQGEGVLTVARKGDGFVVQSTHCELTCSVVIDAAGKLSRFSRRVPMNEFGVQYFEDGTRSDVLDFKFFEGGYGGSVSVEGNRRNHCFLIKKDKIREYASRRDCIVTGPIAYKAVPGDLITIGDAAGMVDPFCGEGMRQALETGMLAARVVARGLRRGSGYEGIRRRYRVEWDRRWGRKRAVGAALRGVLNYPAVFRAGLNVSPQWLLRRLWD